MTDQAQEHSVRSPSSAHRWRRCAGSINAERGLPDRVGIEAAEGTLFHEHAEVCVVTGLDPQAMLPGVECVVSGHKVVYNDEMAMHLQGGINYIYNRMETATWETKNPVLMVEQRVKIEPWTLEPGGFGTSDLCMILADEKRIVVFDWKYGLIAVSPYKNDQLMLYALGCWESLASTHFAGVDPFEIEVELTIWQPRVPGAGGTWKTTMGDLLLEGEQIKIDAAATYEFDAPRTPGTKQCQYCKASATCAELARYNLEQFSLRFDDIDDSLEYGIELPDPDISSWTPERRAYVLLHKKVFERWFKKLHEDALVAFSQGQDYPFMKMVTGKSGDRYYRESQKETVIKILTEELKGKKISPVIHEPISPAQAQKALGKKKYDLLLKEYVEIPPGKPILVPETDPRIALPNLGEQLAEALNGLEDDGDE
jgi:hypothetical protein